MSIVEELAQASNGLTMMSESDYPFEVFLWSDQAKESLTTEKLLQLTDHPQNSPVEIVELEDFFRKSTEDKDWHDETQKENVRKFKLLVNTLKANLLDIQVYRVGMIDIDIYIVGKTKFDDLAGLSTKVVET